jgi:hypothetical protein
MKCVEQVGLYLMPGAKKYCDTNLSSKVLTSETIHYYDSESLNNVKIRAGQFLRGT